MDLDKLQVINGMDDNPNAINTYDAFTGDKFIYITEDFNDNKLKAVIEVDNEESIHCDDCDFKDYRCGGINCNAYIIERLND